MAFNIIKVLALPGAPDIQSNTMYVLKDINNKITTHFSDMNGSSLLEVTSEAGPSIKTYGTFTELTADLTLTASTLAYVIDASDDPSVYAGHATYFYNHLTTTWTKLTDASLNEFSIVGGALYFKGAPVGFSAGTYPSYGWPDVDYYKFDIITANTFSTSLRIASLNGYSSAGLKINFYYKDAVNADVWHLEHVTDFTNGIMDYAYLYTTLNRLNMYVFKVNITDINNINLLIESNLITGQMLQNEAYSDASYDVVNATLSKTNAVGVKTINLIDKITAKSDLSIARSLTVSAPPTYNDFDRAQSIINLRPRKYTLGLDSTPANITVLGGELTTGQVVYTKDGLNNLTERTVTVLSSEARYLGCDYNNNLTRNIESFKNLVWTQEAVVNTFIGYNAGVFTIPTACMTVSGTGGNTTYSMTSMSVDEDAYNGTSTYYAGGIGSIIVSGAKVIKTINRVYMIGGWNTSSSAYQLKIFTSDISGTSETPTFTDTGMVLPTGVRYNNVFVVNNYVYIIGGDTTAIYRAAIDVNGLLGVFTLYTAQTFLSIQDCEVILTKGKVYLVGGKDNATLLALNTVYSMTVTDTGELGSYVAEPALPYAVFGHRCVTFGNVAYLIGGQVDNVTYYDGVYKVPIDDNGNLGAWTLDSLLPGKMSYGNVYIKDFSLIYKAGYNGVYNNNINYKANIEGFYVVKDSRYYKQTINLTPALTELPIVIYQAGQIPKIYTGYTLSYNPTPYFSNPTKETTTTDMVTWVRGSDLPIAIEYGITILTSTKCYLIDPSIRTIYVAPVDGLGVIGTFVYHSKFSIYSTTALTNAVRLKDKIYLIGGLYTFWTQLDESDNIGFWQKGPLLINSINSNPYGNAIAIAGNYLYVFCGSYINVARIGHDGLIEEFSSHSSAPVSTRDVFVTSSRIYYFGYSAASMYYMVINADGTIGPSVVGTSFPEFMTRGKMIVTKNRVWYIGGYTTTTTNTNTNKVYTAVVNPDGTLGVWSAGTTLIKPTSNSNITVTPTKVYLIGGNTTASTVETYVSDFDGWVSGTFTGQPDHEPVTVPILSKTINEDTITITTDTLIGTGRRTSTIIELNKHDTVTRLKGDLWFSF